VNGGIQAIRCSDSSLAARWSSSVYTIRASVSRSEDLAVILSFSHAKRLKKVGNHSFPA